MITLIQPHFERVGGLEKAARNLISAFIKKGIRPTLLTTKCTQKIFDCDVVSLDIESKKGPSFFRDFEIKCKKWLEKHPQNIIFGLDRVAHFQTHYRAGNGVHAGYLKRKKEHLSPFKYYLDLLRPIHRFYLEWEKKAFTSPTLQLLFTNSQMVKNELLTFYPSLQGRIEVIHNGVEWEAYSSPFEDSLFSNGDRDYRFLFVGNGYERKGLSYLLKAFSKLPKNCTLTVVGGEKHPERYQLLAKRVGILDRVFFEGAQSSLTSYYQRADALVIPSIYDPFANTTVEALAMGLYVISSPFNGGKEVLHADSGCTLPSLKDVQSFTQILDSARSYCKTQARANLIRQSYRHLDYSHQLGKLVELVLKNSETCTISHI